MTDFSKALIYVFRELTEINVLYHSSKENWVATMESIYRIAKPGYAGWNNRLIYNNIIGDWAPYSELVNKGIIDGALIRGNACSINLPREIFDKVLGLNPLSIHELSTTTWDTQKEQSVTTIIEYNGIAVAEAILVGLTVSIITYVIITKRF